ncbi:hypothetical protein MRX96_038574 [Rhipicephalus microplus]
MAGSEAVIYCSSDIVKNSLKMGIEKITTKYDTVGALNKDPEESGRLTDIEVDQVECCFKSHKTYVYGCHCLANLYFTDVSQDGKPGRWELARTGVPVLILDKGETRARTRRMVHVVLAERGTGFALWKDVIDNLSSYQKSAVTFHTMHLSSDHRRMAGTQLRRARCGAGILGEGRRTDLGSLEYQLVCSQKQQESQEEEQGVQAQASSRQERDLSALLLPARHQCRKW